MAGKANFSLIKGDTFTRNCTFTNKTTGSPVNLSGSTISGKVVTSEQSVNLDCSIVNATAGQFKFGLTSIVTTGLKSGIAQIEVQVTYSDSTVQTLFNGNLNILEQIA